MPLRLGARRGGCEYIARAPDTRAYGVMPRAPSRRHSVGATTDRRHRAEIPMPRVHNRRHFVSATADRRHRAGIPLAPL